MCPVCFANQWISQDIPSLSSQSKHVKMDIHWFGNYTYTNLLYWFGEVSRYENISQPCLHLLLHSTAGHCIQEESDPRSYEATKAISKKAQKKFWGSNGIRMASMIVMWCSTNWAMKPCWKQVLVVGSFQQGFIAQLVEHCTSIVEVMDLNPVGASFYFLARLSLQLL